MDLRQLRKQAALSAEQVSVDLDVSFSTVRNWEAGRTIPTMSIYKIGKLLNLYNCSFEALERAVIQSRQKAGFHD